MMSRSFQVSVHGKGFDIDIEDGEKIRGFYTFRRVKADSTAEAEEIATIEVIEDESVKIYASETERKNGKWRIEPKEAIELSFWGKIFHKTPEGFIFYKEEND